MKKSKLLLAGLLTLILIPTVTYSTTMGTFDFETGVLTFTYDGYFPQLYDPIISFYDTQDAITPYQTGHWPNPVDFLTDGKPDFMIYIYQYGLGGWMDGSQRVSWEFSNQYRGNGIDFQGYRINDVSFYKNERTILEGGPYPWGEISFSVIDSWTAIVDATPVPEPATMLLLGSGLIGLAGYGRKKLFKK